MVDIAIVGAVTHQSTGLDKITELVERGQAVSRRQGDGPIPVSIEERIRVIRIAFACARDALANALSRSSARFANEMGAASIPLTLAASSNRLRRHFRLRRRPCENCHATEVRDSRFQYLDPLGIQLERQIGDAGEISTWVS